MALGRRNTFGSLPSIFDDIFDTNFDSTDFSGSGTTLPSVNIQETEEKFVIEVAAPGMEKDNFNIELQDNVLNISAEKTEEKESERYTRREFNYESFRRSFALPKSVADDKIEAKYSNGVLILQIPKSEDSKTKVARRINIR